MVRFVNDVNGNLKVIKYPYGKHGKDTTCLVRCNYGTKKV